MRTNSVKQYIQKTSETPTSEVVAKGGVSNAQHIVDCVAQWSLDNRVQLNSEKCKELRISFTKKQSEFHPILVNGNQLEVVRSAKLLGVIITSDLSWNDHVNETVKKACKRLCFLVQLNPFAPGDFAEKRVLKLVEWFSVTVVL